MKLLATPSTSLQTLHDTTIDLGDGRTRFFRLCPAFKPEVWPLGREITLSADRTETTARGRQVIPAGATIKLVAIETKYMGSLDDDDALIEAGHRLLFEVVEA